MNMSRKYVWVGIACLVLLVLMPNMTSAAHIVTINMVKNGGFEEGSGVDADDWSGFWTGRWHRVCGGSTPNEPHAGNCMAHNYRNEMYQNDIDFTNIDELTFYWKTTGSQTLNISIGGNLYWSETSNKPDWTKETVDVKGVTSKKLLEFYAYTDYNLRLDSVTGNVEVDLEEIRNPSFEQELGDNPLVQWDTWTDVDMVSGSHSESVAQSTDTFYHGSQSLKFVADVDGIGTTMAGVGQDIDLSSMTPYLNFRMYTEGGQGDAYIVVAVEGNPVWQYSGETIWEEFSAPLSGYSGTKEVSIYAIATGASASNITAYIDSVSFGSLDDVVLKGKVYDAVIGGVLSGVGVNCSQMGGVVTDTSDAMGNYEITGLFTNYDIYLDASKTDYNHHQTYFHFSNGGTKTVNIYMLPYTEHGLYGLVIDHNGEAVPQATVDVWNNTWSNTTNANDYGYFVFKNLTGLYEMQASKAGMQGSAIETITMEDIITTLDNCEAVTGWNSSGSVAINSTFKKQGSYSIRCNDTDALLCNKTFAPANNTNLTYGKLQFWAYIENSSAINTLEVSLIDSSTDYRKWTGLSGTDGWNYFELWIPDASGSANLSDIVKFEVNATGSGEIVILFDEIRTFEPATDFVFLTLYGFFTLTISAKNIDTAESIMSFTATLDGAETEGTTTGVVSFTQVVGGLHTVYVSAEGYYGGTGSPFVWHNMTYAVYLLSTEVSENVTGGAGVYYPPPHLVEFRVVDIWGVPLSNIAVNATGYETTVVNLTWWQKLFGFSSEIEVYNSTATGTTDSAGHISFFMVETIKYKMWFTNASQNVSAYREVYPKDDRYTITTGTIPEQRIAYWITTEQNNSANSGNISIHYCDYNTPNVKTNWVNFSVYYADNASLIFSHNFTSPTDVNENTSIDLNASFVYKVKIVADHDDFGEIKSYSTVVFVMPEKPKFPIEGLNDWQITMFGMFLIIFAALIFGAVSSGVGGLVVTFMSAAFYYFGFLPLIPKAAAYVIFPLIIIVAVINKISEQRAEEMG